MKTIIVMLANIETVDNLFEIVNELEFDFACEFNMNGRQGDFKNIFEDMEIVINWINDRFESGYYHTSVVLDGMRDCKAKLVQMKECI